MIFFRSQERRIEIQKSPGESRGFFVFITAAFSSKPDELSGMVINLKDVDLCFQKHLTVPLRARGLGEIAKKLFHSFSKGFPGRMGWVQIKMGNKTLRYDGQNFLIQTRLMITWKQGQGEVTRKIRMVSRQWGRKPFESLKNRKWKTAEEFVQVVQGLELGVQSVEIWMSEKNFWQKWNFT